jgi:IS605 OrfB family transposase
MKLTVAVKLRPTPEQATALLRTLEAANSAANAISTLAWEHATFSQFKLHKIAYGPVRAGGVLSAQMVVRLIAKVADSYKLDKRTRRTFHRHGAIAYDDRILSWSPEAVSIWTTEGRQRIPFVCGDQQRALLANRQGESDLVYRGGQWYLFATANVTEPESDEPIDALGCDLGIVSILTDSDGTSYSGAAVERNRRIFAHRRRNLQGKQTRSARRKLRRIAGRQARFQRNENHRISKYVVATAKDTHRAIALEDLTGMRTRTTVRRRQRARHANWSFAHLRHCLTYKARLSGVVLVLVDPRNSSRTCCRCGCIDKANRRSQSSFLCVQCGYAAGADHNAAQVIRHRARAVVNLPMVPVVRDHEGQAQEL